MKGFHGKLKRGKGTQKQPVFGVFERNAGVYTETVEDCKKPTLQGIIRGKVGIESEIHTDSWKGYNVLVGVGFNRYFRVKYGEVRSGFGFLEQSLASPINLLKLIKMVIKSILMGWSHFKFLQPKRGLDLFQATCGARRMRRLAKFNGLQK